MEPYTPITLPYFAPSHLLPEPLPTTEQILASTKFLVPYTQYTHVGEVGVVRIGKHFVGKYGDSVRALEGETMLFVEKATGGKVPVPRVYAIYTYSNDDTNNDSSTNMSSSSSDNNGNNEDGGEDTTMTTTKTETKPKKMKTMIVMEYIEGATLNRAMLTESPRRLEALAAQLRAQMDELRRIPSPGYYGALGRRPFVDQYRGNEYGPFAADALAEMTAATFDTMFPRRRGRRFAELRDFFIAGIRWSVSATAGDDANLVFGSGSGRPVFSHGDLHEANVIIRPDGVPCIIDYGAAGFYPAHHERIRVMTLGTRLDFLRDKFEAECNIATFTQKSWAEVERNARFCGQSEIESDDVPSSSLSLVVE